MVTSLHTMIFFAKNSVHSGSPQELEISGATRPSHKTVGETWILFCRPYLTIYSMSPCHGGSRQIVRTGVLEVVGDTNASIWMFFVLQQFLELLHCVLRQDFCSYFCELVTNLRGCQVQYWHVEKLFLAFKELQHSLSNNSKEPMTQHVQGEKTCKSSLETR